jgi:hypothetical protein
MEYATRGLNAKPLPEHETMQIKKIEGIEGEKRYNNAEDLFERIVKPGDTIILLSFIGATAHYYEICYY